VPPKYRFQRTLGFECRTVQSWILPILSEQAHWLGRWLAHVEINVRLFVAFGMLLSPQYQ
jgi:hypothetical protein